MLIAAPVMIEKRSDKIMDIRFDENGFIYISVFEFVKLLINSLSETNYEKLNYYLTLGVLYHQ